MNHLICTPKNRAWTLTLFQKLTPACLPQAHHHLRALHNLCWTFGELRLHRLDPSQTPALAAFSAQQAAALDTTGVALGTFETAVSEVMAAGCAEALQALQSRLDQFALRQVSTSAHAL